MIELKQVSRTGRQQEPLLRDISLTINPAEQLAISGPSGSGKSLLLRTIARLDPLTGGELIFCGNPVSASDTPRYRSHVMYLHQLPALLEGAVKTNLQHAFGFHIHRGRTFSEQNATELFTRMGRETSLLQRSSSHLSGGERQIVALVRALILQPRVLLLDEATSALDEASAVLVEQVIAEWVKAEPANSDAARAVVWVTHNDAQRERVATRVLQIKDGRLQ